MGTNKRRSKAAPTMADVARLAGVNRVTASVALRSARAGTHVSEATRQRILEAARELGYTPNAIAMALRSQRTDIIGYYVGPGTPNYHDPFTAAVLNGLHRACLRHRKDLLMYSGYQLSSPDESYAALSGGKLDGVVLIPSPINPVVQRLAESHLPVVAIANVLEGIPAVVVDDVGGAQLLAEYLARQGHRRVLFRTEPHRLTSPTRRHTAFVAAAQAHNVEVVTTQAQDYSGQLSDQERELLTGPAAQRVSAVFCWADSYAYHLLADCATLGIRVPEDLAIVGFDGIPTTVPPARMLTTVRAPWSHVAETALDTLVQIIDGQEVALETVVPVELVIGDTA